MTTTSLPGSAALTGLDLPLLRARVTMRLLDDTTLPAYKGAMLRGGFGYAFQRASCPPGMLGRLRFVRSQYPVPLSLGL